jgi:tripartite-type tricarboxylate transporter receptor subunit TctC
MASTLLVAKLDLPASNLQDFVTYARANREKLTFGSAGVGSISHYACVLLLSNLKLNITHVPYRGVAPAMNDLMGGHVDFMCDQTTTALPQVLGGTIKAIAALSDQPLPQAPQVPTAGAAGYRDVNLRSWNAIFVRKGTPAPVRQRLNDALRAALVDPDVVRQMTAVGVELPRGADLEPGAVSALIAQGLEHDVPVLRAKGEYLD